MESAPFGVSRLKCGSGERRERRRFWIPVGAAHRAARGIQVSHTFLHPRRGDPRGRPSMRGTARLGVRALQNGKSPSARAGDGTRPYGGQRTIPENGGRGKPLPYGFQVSLSFLRRGAPWGSRRELRKSRKHPHPSRFACHLPPCRGKAGAGGPGVPPLREKRSGSVIETVPLIHPSVRTGAPSPKGRPFCIGSVS